MAIYASFFIGDLLNAAGDVISEPSTSYLNQHEREARVTVAFGTHRLAAEGVELEYPFSDEGDVILYATATMLDDDAEVPDWLEELLENDSEGAVITLTCGEFQWTSVMGLEEA
jgi:hypothetical protein